MPPRSWKLRIEDILQATARIQRYTDGMSFETFGVDEKTVDAVVRNLTVIGEAANHIPSEVQEHHPEVPWAQMRGIRNVLMHEYFGVSLPIIWKTIRQDLPALVPTLEAILQE